MEMDAILEMNGCKTRYIGNYRRRNGCKTRYIRNYRRRNGCNLGDEWMQNTIYKKL